MYCQLQAFQRRQKQVATSRQEGRSEEVQANFNNWISYQDKASIPGRR